MSDVWEDGNKSPKILLSRVKIYFWILQRNPDLTLNTWQLANKKIIDEPTGIKVIFHGRKKKLVQVGRYKARILLRP